MKYRQVLITVVVLILATKLIAQQHPPFWSEIQEFKRQDSINPPPQNAILFVGSSSFRFWNNMQEMFPNHTVINRGFGGSNLVDLARYMNDIVYPYNPKQIVIYSGENDLAPGNITPDTAFKRFTTVYNLIRARYPDVPVAYVSIKPSPSRIHLKHLMIATNRRIRDFLKEEKNATYIDVFSRMLDKNGNPLEELFVADNLHMNQLGYAIWQKQIQPILVK